jgi:hypothetical protein
MYESRNIIICEHLLPLVKGLVVLALGAMGNFDTEQLLQAQALDLAHGYAQRPRRSLTFLNEISLLDTHIPSQGA